MGCDIHLHIEVKINGVWHHYSVPPVPRSYVLFGLMAGVRMDMPEFHRPKNTLPADISEVTNISAQRFSDGYGHDWSWLSHDEVCQLYKWWDSYWRGQGKTQELSWELDLDHRYFGYAEGNSWSDDEWLRDKLFEDVRFVFWFDN
jgi:hypothetical protein